MRRNYAYIRIGSNRTVHRIRAVSPERDGYVTVTFQNWRSLRFKRADLTLLAGRR